MATIGSAARTRHESGRLAENGRSSPGALALGLPRDATIIGRMPRRPGDVEALIRGSAPRVHTQCPHPVSTPSVHSRGTTGVSPSVGAEPGPKKGSTP